VLYPKCPFPSSISTPKAARAWGLAMGVYGALCTIAQRAPSQLERWWVKREFRSHVHLKEAYMLLAAREALESDNIGLSEALDASTNIHSSACSMRDAMNMLLDWLISHRVAPYGILMTTSQYWSSNDGSKIQRYMETMSTTHDKFKHFAQQVCF